MNLFLIKGFDIYYTFLIDIVCLPPHTYIIAVILHLFPVFQIHGPDVAIKQTRGVRDSICPCTVKVHQSSHMTLVPVTLHWAVSCKVWLVTFSSFCTPHTEWKCRNICHRCQWVACREEPELELETRFKGQKVYNSIKSQVRWEVSHL